MNANACFGVILALLAASLILAPPVLAKETVNINFLAIESDADYYIVTAGPTVLSFEIDGTKAKVVKMEDSGGEIYSRYYTEKLQGSSLTISHGETNDSVFTPLTININENLYKGDCADTDGINFYEKGSVTSDGTTNEDECDSQWNVKEYNCFGDPIIFECPNGCMHGTCLVGTDACEDSDHGKEYYFKGTLTSGPTNVVSDYCDEDGDLIEHYCFKLAGHAFEAYECPNGCEDGKCVKSGCTDSDGGKDYFTKGTVTNGITVLTDYCMTKYDLKEYSCMTASSHKSVVYTCPKGCLEGACKTGEAPPPEPTPEPNITCVDSDQGKNFQTRGTVTIGNSTYEDICENNVLKEYECKNSTTKSTSLYQCPYGCEQGRCKDKPAEPPANETDDQTDDTPGDETPEPAPAPQKNFIELFFEWLASLFGC
ncbi:MAG: hypothetical protein JW754_02300 [Candidatus Aenigmarchaeota archaeon]|nr:hypothetical protein [Candidatus Aenigmarchaeota archaeon]